MPENLLSITVLNSLVHLILKSPVSSHADFAVMFIQLTPLVQLAVRVSCLLVYYGKFDGRFLSEEDLDLQDKNTLDLRAFSK